MIKIGLPKGNSKSKSLNLIRDIMGCEINEKQLHFRHNDFDFFLLKQRDMPELIEKGLIDVGIVPEEWIIEKNVTVDIIDKLDWCDTRISFISNIENNILNTGEKIRCVTEFPNISKRFLNDIVAEYEIYVISGSSEAFVPTFFNSCIDCVETGNTLKCNNLKEEQVILQSKTVIVKNCKQPYNDDIKCFLKEIK